MELPIELRNLVEGELEKLNIIDLQKIAEGISLKYRNESGKGKRLVTESVEAISYAVVRMPATYGAVYTALKNMLQLCDFKIESLLDVGAGTGAGTWAAYNLLDVDKIKCLEREDAMMELGKSFTEKSSILELQSAEWKKFDLLNSDIDETADLVICSYVLNELNESDREIALKKLWEATNKVLLIIEPGTPIGFSEIKAIRKKIMDYGGSIIAPCPNIMECPMPENDWCHATCRVARTKVHKILKNGDVPYEDEKFSYIAVCKDDVIRNDDIARVLRHPKIESGKITLKLCTNDGIYEKIVTKKDKEMFKIARKCGCGDLINLKT